MIAWLSESLPMPTNKRRYKAPGWPAGFSLIELSIVLIIFALLASSMLTPLAAQRQAADARAAREQLTRACESLYGFALQHGRLPCPAAPDLTEDAGDAGVEACPRTHGVLPWRTLALPQSDPWHNRLTYHADRNFTRNPPPGALSAFDLDSRASAHVLPRAGAGNRLADTIPAIVVSHGANGHGAYRRSGHLVPGGSSDEQENADGDLSFVDHLPDDHYDDLLCWLPPAILASRMVQAGRLP